ncbi:UNVERIFIED_CONTAM: hypothetical protein FKN15_050799 [Acipenser sinensis]
MESQMTRCKVVVVGDTQCGKTALLHVFAKDCYPENYVATVFENYTASFEIEKQRIELNMWDTSGQNTFIQCCQIKKISHIDSSTPKCCLLPSASIIFWGGSGGFLWPTSGNLGCETLATPDSGTLAASLGGDVQASPGNSGPGPPNLRQLRTLRQRQLWTLAQNASERMYSPRPPGKRLVFWF